MQIFIFLFPCYEGVMVISIAPFFHWPISSILMVSMGFPSSPNTQAVVFPTSPFFFLYKSFVTL